jgi:hypothetical protein
MRERRILFNFLKRALRKFRNFGVWRILDIDGHSLGIGIGGGIITVEARVSTLTVGCY